MVSDDGEWEGMDAIDGSNKRLKNEGMKCLLAHKDFLLFLSEKAFLHISSHFDLPSSAKYLKSW